MNISTDVIDKVMVNKILCNLFLIDGQSIASKIKKEPRKAQPSIAICEWACKTFPYGMNERFTNGVTLIKSPDRAVIIKKKKEIWINIFGIEATP